MKKIISLLITIALFASLMVGAAFSIDLQEDELSVSGWAFDASSINANKGVPLEIPQNVTDGSLISHWHTMINPKAGASALLNGNFTVGHRDRRLQVLPERVRIRH